MLGYGIKESNSVDLHEITAYTGFIASIKDDLGEICNCDRFHILELVMDCYAFQIWHIGSIDVLIHTSIFSQD